jgi:hypothetical protein
MSFRINSRPSPDNVSELLIYTFAEKRIPLASNNTIDKSPGKIEYKHENAVADV